MRIHRETLRFPSATPGITLAGTLTRPRVGRGAAPVLLLSGSGPQDRDESIAGHRPFAVLAEHLAASGFSTLRFDDRGVGESEGDYLAASADLLVADAGRAMDALRELSAEPRVVLLGHSQGTLIATRAAVSRPEQTEALALLAGMGRPGRTALLDQHRRICQAEGWSLEVIEESLPFKEQLFEVLLKAQRQLDEGGDEAAVLLAARRTLLHLMTGGEGLEVLGAEDREATEEAVEDLLEWEWRFLLDADPRRDLCRVRCPVLAMAGSRDTQISSREDLGAIEAALKAGGNDQVTVAELPRHNHLFQLCESGAPGEYELLESVWSEPSLKVVTDWLLDL